MSDACLGAGSRSPDRRNPEETGDRGTLSTAGRRDRSRAARREPRPGNPDCKRQVPRGLPRDPRVRFTEGKGPIHCAAAGPRRGEIRGPEGVRVARDQSRHQCGGLRFR